MRYDEVEFRCPYCGTRHTLTTALGECAGKVYDLKNAPNAVLIALEKEELSCKNCNVKIAFQIFVEAQAYPRIRRKNG